MTRGSSHWVLTPEMQSFKAAILYAPVVSICDVRHQEEDLSCSAGCRGKRGA